MSIYTSYYIVKDIEGVSFDDFLWQYPLKRIGYAHYIFYQKTNPKENKLKHYLEDDKDVEAVNYLRTIIKNKDKG